MPPCDSVYHFPVDSLITVAIRAADASMPTIGSIPHQRSSTIARTSIFLFTYTSDELESVSIAQPRAEKYRTSIRRLRRARNYRASEDTLHNRSPGDPRALAALLGLNYGFACSDFRWAFSDHSRALLACSSACLESSWAVR